MSTHGSPPTEASPHRRGATVRLAATRMHPPLIVYVTLDIESPRLGFVRLDAIDQLLVAARASMK